MVRPPHPSLRQPASDLIGGHWRTLTGDGIVSQNPAHPDRVVWQGSPVLEHVDEAVTAARAALSQWSAAPFEYRAAVLRRYADLCKARAGQIAELISDETGKVMWEARGEAAALATKVGITFDRSPTGGLARVMDFSISLSETRTGRCQFRPHGVMAIIAPFNFPAFMPNGQFIPALAMGNTVVLKPSDKTPGVGQLLAELMAEALESEGAPLGVFNLVQGASDTASALSSHEDIDGILFTGSWAVGRKIVEANLDRPGRMIALELGGNNPAVVLPDADLKQAAIEIVRCAFNTTGQRCTCTRRVVVHEAIADRVVPLLGKCASNLVFGDPRAEHPVFAGPLISREARQAVFDAQCRFVRNGGQVILQSSELPSADGWFLTPGIIEVDRFTRAEVDACGYDEEVFGPLLRVATVASLDEAIEQANATKFGLTASVFTKSQADAERFLREARAGCVNVNTGTAGASGRLPIGGLGISGNHRPMGSFALDCCVYPVAQMIETSGAGGLAEGMRFDDEWVGKP